MRARLFFTALLLIGGAPAHAQEVFGGILAHDISSPLVAEEPVPGLREDGLQVQLGWRGKRLNALSLIGSPSPQVFASVATSAETHFVAAGLSWRIGGKVFVRPGIGLAVHTRPDDASRFGYRTDLGSRVLFAPELGIGYQLSDRVAIEATWVHLSNAQLFSEQNIGLESVGVRVSMRIP